jgi:hypothetical protein
MQKYEDYVIHGISSDTSDRDETDDEPDLNESDEESDSEEGE